MKTILTPTEIRAAERELNERLTALMTEVEKIEVNTLQVSGDFQGQRADESSEDAALERDIPALAAETRLANEVRAALRRIAIGNYGVCELCDRAIERGRLGVIPQARTCFACARREEIQSNR